VHFLAELSANQARHPVPGLKDYMNVDLRQSRVMKKGSLVGVYLTTANDFVIRAEAGIQAFPN